MRSHRRREPLDHVLIAGHANDLDDIREALATLPADAYGQVLIETSVDTPLCLSSPTRMTIHRVDGTTGSLADAVAGWIAEWVPDEPDPQRRVTAWIGTHARSHVGSIHSGFGWAVEHL